jgi:hypothetical protein
MTYNIKSTNKADLINKLNILWTIGVRPHNFDGINKPTVQQFVNKFATSWPIIISISCYNKQYGFNYGESESNLSTLGQAVDALSVATVVFPNAAKYKIDYLKSDGTVKEYIISNPIDADATKITCYAYGRGVRSFIKSNVISLEKV